MIFGNQNCNKLHRRNSFFSPLVTFSVTEVINVATNGDKSPEKPEPKMEVTVNGDKSPEETESDEIAVAANGDKSLEKPEPKMEVIVNGDKSPEEAESDQIEIIDKSRT